MSCVHSELNTSQHKRIKAFEYLCLVDLRWPLSNPLSRMLLYSQKHSPLQHVHGVYLVLGSSNIAPAAGPESAVGEVHLATFKMCMLAERLDEFDGILPFVVTL